MTLGCHPTVQAWKLRAPVTLALAGNPNVGKSSVFARLTGLGVSTANYPGTTVGVNLATTRFGDREVGVMDLPGTYALGSVSEDQRVARQALLDGRPDVVLAIVDATRLERNLYLPLQLLDLGYPLVVALNMVDEAWRDGLRVDPVRLGQSLGVPVVPTVAVRGQGLDRLVALGLRVARNGARREGTRRYGRDVEEAIDGIAAALADAGGPLPWGLGARGVAVLLLEEDAELVAAIAALPGGPAVLAAARRAAALVETRHGERAPLRIARERHGLAGALAADVQTRVAAPARIEARLRHLTTAPATGYPLLALVLATLFTTLFWGGTALADLLGGAWERWASPVIRQAIEAGLGTGLAGRTLLWGVDAGVNAAVSVGIPYVLVFYLFLSMLEDSGYLNAVAFLTDPLMHRLGLHGRAAIPLVAGAGCNVPAIMGLRILATGRERILAGVLVCLVPCSARTAVIAGAVARYAGWAPAALVYLLTAALAVAVGATLDRLLPGPPTGLVMEMFPFRLPRLRVVLAGTWLRFREFVVVATPIVLAGSLVLGLIYETGLLWAFSAPLAPVVEGWLGLPPVAGLTLLFAVLRKELALQLLIALAVGQYGPGAADLLHFMDRGQIFTYALVNTLYIPCVATIAVLGRELGWRRALTISALTVGLAILVGGVTHRLLALG